MKRFFLFWFVFLLSTVSYAEITDVRGVWDSGGTVIIDGFGFGQKAQPAPVVWDDLEDGLSNTSASIGGWASVNSLGISTAQQRHPSSNYSAHHNFVSEATAGFRGNSSPVSQKWFVQYWFYLDPNLIGELLLMVLVISFSQTSRFFVCGALEVLPRIL